MGNISYMTSSLVTNHEGAKNVSLCGRILIREGIFHRRDHHDPNSCLFRRECGPPFPRSPWSIERHEWITPYGYGCLLSDPTLILEFDKDTRVGKVKGHKREKAESENGPTYSVNRKSNPTTFPFIIYLNLPYSLRTLHP